MSSAPNLVAGRLARNLPSSFSSQAQPALRVTGYGVSRLGLVRSKAAQADQPPHPAAAHPHMRDGVPVKKLTASLALPLANRLKAYCGAAGRFQYAVIGDAIDRYLIEAVGQLNDAQKDAMAEIAAGLCSEASPDKAGADAGAAALPCPLNTAYADMAPAAPLACAAPVAPSGGTAPATKPSDGAPLAPSAGAALVAPSGDGEPIALPATPPGDGAAAAAHDAPAEAPRPGHNRLACMLDRLLPRCWHS